MFLSLTLETSPNFFRRAEVHYQLGRTNFLCDSYQESIEQFKRCLDVIWDNSHYKMGTKVDLLIKIGLVYQRLNPQHAEQYFYQALSLNKNIESVSQQLAWWYFKSGSPIKAKSIIKEAFLKNEESSENLYILGRCLLKEKSWNSALNAFRAALHLNKTVAAYWASLTVVLHHLKFFLEALEALLQA